MRQQLAQSWINNPDVTQLTVMAMLGPEQTIFMYADMSHIEFHVCLKYLCVLMCHIFQAREEQDKLPDGGAGLHVLRPKPGQS